MGRINLNEGWALREAPLDWQKERAGQVMGLIDGWYTDGSLPLDVHMPLMAAGIIKDPVLADYCFDSEWIEKRSWWFKKHFRYEADESYRSLELVIESLDVHADIFLNGAYLGHHESAHFPFRKEVSGEVVPGVNCLLIRLTTGLEYVSDQDLAEIGFAVSTEAGNGCPERGDKRRAFLRKPAYVFGWDWCPRAGTVAIAKNAYLECHPIAAIRSINMETLEIKARETDTGKNEAPETGTPDLGHTVRIRAGLSVELFDITASADTDIQLALFLDGKEAACGALKDVFLSSGLNYFDLHLTVEDAQLWWPNGMGAQPLYEVRAFVHCRGRVSEYPSFRYGLREIKLDSRRTDDKNRDFSFWVNGKRVFCKGGNWIPADPVYARITPEKYDKLVREAAAAHFNMLRAWGGGFYERDEFYDACDRYGLMVWQDLMFTCGAYPDHLTGMYDLIGKELDYQTNRLASRTCMALFCGNNENHVALTGWYGDAVSLSYGKQYGLKTSNVQAPEYVRKNCPWIPYWNGTPYGGAQPNAYNAGDVHYWGEGMMNPDMAVRIEPREFDKVTARFVSEYGYPGPCVKESTENYFDGQPVSRNSKIWNLHNNTFEKLTVAAGIRKNFTEGSDRDLSLDEYLLYAGAVQSLMLEYSLESLRFKHFCGGGLFWMYNDCWGEVGWSIIDYYLNRKISFYGVRRAFAPVKLILREQDGILWLTGCNDTGTDFSFTVNYGYRRFDGGEDAHQAARIELPAYSRVTVLAFEKGNRDPSLGLWYAAPEGVLQSMQIQPALLRPFDVKIATPSKASVEFTKSDTGFKAIVTAQTYCHLAYFEAPCNVLFSDNYFTLLPGEKREVVIEGGMDPPPALKWV